MANSRRRLQLLLRPLLVPLRPLFLLLFLSVPITSAEPTLLLISTIAPPVPTALPDQQLHNIIEALIGAGDFSDWANVLSAADPTTFPFTATLFIPKDDVLANILPRSSPPIPLFDPSIFAYHIVPQLLSFSDLQRFPIGSRLPTLVPDKSIFIANNSRSNYTIDNSRITHPDLFINGPVAVHGIASTLDYNAFGNGLFESSTSSDAPSSSSSNGSSAEPPAKNDDENDVCLRSGAGSDAACLCCEFPIVLSIVVCAVLWFKNIHGFYSIR